MIDRDELGIIHHAQATFHVPKYQEPAPGWRSDPAESPAGGMTGLGVHMVDTLQYLLGPIARVTARSKRILARSPLDDMTTVLLEFARGPLGTLDTSLVLPRTCDVVVVGHQRIAASRQDGSRLLVQEVTDPAPSEVPIERTDELVEQLEEFARCAGDGALPETDAATAVGVVAVLEAIVASAASGDTVEVRAPEAQHG
jgi:predicted dehydrogenase